MGASLGAVADAEADAEHGHVLVHVLVYVHVTVDVTVDVIVSVQVSVTVHAPPPHGRMCVSLHNIDLTRASRASGAWATDPSTNPQTFASLSADSASAALPVAIR